MTENEPPGGALLRGIDLERATVLDLQRALDTGHLDAVALTTFYLRRIRAVDQLLNAVIETNPQALREAAQSDAHRRRHGARSVLEGIPVLLKDNIDTADRQPTTAGSLALLGARPARDAFLVRGCAPRRGDPRQGQPVGVGELPLPRSSSGWSAPRRPDQQPVRAGPQPVRLQQRLGRGGRRPTSRRSTIGTETDGSIVCPAGANGMVGIKPTLGLVSRSGVVPISAGQDTAGPMARTVTDAAAVLSVIQGVDPADPATAAAAPHAAGTTAVPRPDALAGTRIGVWRAVAGADAEVHAVARRGGGRVARGRGHRGGRPRPARARTCSRGRVRRRCWTSSSTTSTPTWPRRRAAPRRPGRR